MRRLELTLGTPAENLAFDEALLDWAEDDAPLLELLRLWESPQPIVVVGRSSRIHLEVDEVACRERGIPILRRSSGGAAIVAGPGCLMYALLLSYKLRPELKDIRRAHAYVLERMAAALRPHVARLECTIAHAGTSDLVIEQGAGGREQGAGGNERAVRLPPAGSPLPAPCKFSGNSLRVKRSHVLYHGTLLYDFDLRLVEACLTMPPRQPEYRGQRPHRDFLTNVPLSRAVMIQAIDGAWPTSEPLVRLPLNRMVKLVAERFSRDSWNYEFP